MTIPALGSFERGGIELADPIPVIPGLRPCRTLCMQGNSLHNNTLLAHGRLYKRRDVKCCILWHLPNETSVNYMFDHIFVRFEVPKAERLRGLRP